MRDKIIQILKKALKEKDIKLKEEEINKIIETPPSVEMGDYSFPCFSFAEKLKQEPNQIALEIREKIRNIPLDFEDIQTSGPYINFFINKKNLAINLIKEVLIKKDNFGKIKSVKKKTMIEFSSPNTNKPLHLGHLRNMAIGESISRISEFNGEKVIRANLNNDRGINICQSMAAYKKYGKNKKPTKKIKSDHFVGDFYVMFNKRSKKNKKLEIESHRLLQKSEQQDKETIKLWKQMNKWALNGFKETYEKFGVHFDKEYYESQIYKKGKDIILKGVEDGIFKKKKKDGAIYINLKNKKLGEKVLLRADGTSLYMTQDIYLAKLKFDQFKLSNSFYISGNEQEYHFNVLFTILKKLGFNFSNNLHHLSYGMVFLPHGKMKSREGTVVDADDLIDDVQELVKKELQSRDKLSKTQLELRSLKIALAAIKYLLLKIDIKKNMIFNPKESINFEGDTGPYIQYSYARACSILKKAKKTKDKNKFKISELSQNEIKLIKKLSQFQEVVLNSHKNLNPALIANYSYQLAQIFNEFYHACPVIGSEQESFRLALIKTFKQVLKNSTYLLGIDVIEKM